MAGISDIVLIYMEDTPFAFARIEDISADHKPDWYHVKLLFLQIPLQVGTWILREAYINGAEFTMNGRKMRLERVICPEEGGASEEPQAHEQDRETKKTALKSNGKVISFKDRKK